MILQLDDRNKKYEVQLEKISQWCGENILLKTIFADSICKHFSSSKYSSWEDWMIDNIKIDGTTPGRKRYHSLRISSKDDIIKLIQFGKLSLLQQYVENIVAEYEVQREMEYIDDKLIEIFANINEKMRQDIPNLSVDYASENIWSIIQHSEVKTEQGECLVDLNYEQLLQSFFKIISSIQVKNPEAYIICFENIDHYVSREGYQDILKLAKEIAERYDMLFIFMVSLSGYVQFDEESITGVTVFNDEIFSLPEWKHMKSFLENNYPIYSAESESIEINCLYSIVDLIAKQELKLNMRDIILLKGINCTLDMKLNVENKLSKPEWEYLFS